MKYRYHTLTIILLCLGCTATYELTGRTDFNPIYDWSPEKKVFIVPYSDHTEEPFNFQIESKLARIAISASSKAGLSFVETPDNAEAFMFVKYEIDTISFIAPSRSFTYRNATIWNNYLTNQVGVSSYGNTVTIPAFEKKKMYVTVELWLMDKQEILTLGVNGNQVRMVSYATSKLSGEDHNMLTYNLLVACIKSIPGVNQKFDMTVPRISLYLKANWLSGIKTRDVANDGYYKNPSRPFNWDDVIYQINNERIYDYFDYKAVIAFLKSIAKCVTY